jgi:hypothetical protein
MEHDPMATERRQAEASDPNRGAGASQRPQTAPAQ